MGKREGAHMLEWLEWFFDCAEFAGTIAFAASGAMMAIDRELDMFGVIFLGVVTAVGGGILRDIILGITPPGAFRNPAYVALAAATALAVFLFAWRHVRLYRKEYRHLGRVVGLLDAIGLGIFGVVGVEAAISRGYGESLFLCVFMGMTTAVGGGMLRDMLSRTVPAVLHKRIYAVASILGCLVYYAIRQTRVSMPFAMVAGMAVTVAVRAVASHFRLDLPIVPVERTDDR